MQDLLEEALTTTRESKQIEFKSAFDPTSNGDWCEVIKDIAAIANSGGGIIVFGLNNNGTFSETPLGVVSEIDHADLTNKISKYTGWIDPGIEIRDIVRNGRKLPAFIIEAAPVALAFERPGTYADGTGKQKTAFGVGTVYFRHGAKSEPGTSADIRSVFDRRLNETRQAWLKQVMKVSRAPLGSQLIVSSIVGRPEAQKPNTVRVVKDPNATPVVLTRDRGDSKGTFMREEVSEEIFDEINNVIDANRVLTKGQSRFFLGAQVYFRIYAERQRVKQKLEEVEKLFLAGACEFYAPNLFWTKQMDADSIARIVTSVYVAPKGHQIHWLMRLAVLLGADFCNWLYDKWDQKWRCYSQAPTFYFSFQEMIRDMGHADARLVAARLAPTARMPVPNEPDVLCSELLNAPTRAEALLSKVCMAVFDGNVQLRSTARELDYIAHGLQIIQRGKQIAESAICAIGQRQPGDFGDHKD